MFAPCPRAAKRDRVWLEFTGRRYRLRRILPSERRILKYADRRFSTLPCIFVLVTRGATSLHYQFLARIYSRSKLPAMGSEAERRLIDRFCLVSITDGEKREAFERWTAGMDAVRAQK